MQGESSPTAQQTSVRGTRLLLFSVFLCPLLINPGVFISFDDIFLTPKLWWLYGVCLPAAGWVLATPGRGALAGAGGVLTALAVWLGWQVLSILVTQAGWAGWWGHASRADGVLMHALYAALLLCGWVWAKCDPGWTRSLALATLITGSTLALSNIAQQLGVLGMIGEGSFAGVATTPLGGILGHRGYMGGALALLLPAGIWGWGVLAHQPNSPRIWMRWLPPVSLTLMTWALLGSYTRGAWLAGVLGLSTWAALSWWQRSEVRTVQWWAPLPLLCGCALFAFSATPSEGARQFSIDQGGGTAQPWLDNSGRTVLWNSATFGIAQKPVFGWGTPALLQAMNARPLEEILTEHSSTGRLISGKLNPSNKEPVRFVMEEPGGKRQVVTLTVEKVHNEYLDYALTYGVLAALCFILLLGWGIWNGRLTAPGLSGALVAYGVYLVTWPDTVRFAPIAWLMLGLALASGVPGKSMRERQSTSH